MNMRFLFFLSLLPFFFPGSASCSAAELTPEEVNSAIDRAVQYLKGKQNADGSWGGNSASKVGRSALCTLALLNSGCNANDPTVRKALVYLRKFGPSNIEGTYVAYCVSLQTMVFSLADPNRDKPLIQRNVKWFEQIQQRDGGQKRRGGWGYGRESASSHYADVSNSQFVVLALYEAERVGVSCSPEIWKLAKEYWENMQISDGSWGYTDTNDPSGSRTSAGIASLLIANGMVNDGSAEVVGADIYCCLDSEGTGESRIRRGFNWLAKYFSATSNPRGSNTYLFYYLYGVERVGRMTGHRYIGNHDWYREGAEFLVKRGESALVSHWKGVGSEEDEHVATSFALLFLARGRRPILLSKIQYEGDDSWNAHSQDINHLTQFVEKQWKMDLTWQTVHWEYASTEDLLQSPVLFLCGNKNPLPRDRDRADKIVEKLREYLDQGGFIFAEAYGDDIGFDAGFRSLMKRVLPEEEYELRVLEQDHPVWSMEFPISTEHIRRIEGIDFGCRTSVVYCPPTQKRSRLAFSERDGNGIGEEEDSIRLIAQRQPISVSRYRPSLSCLWEIAQMLDRGDPYAESVQDQIDAGLEIGCNILAYATERELLNKLAREQEFKMEPKFQRAVDRGILNVGLLEHGGGSNCAPRAIPRLMEAAASRYGAPVSTKVEKISLLNPQLPEYPILFMHGRNAFRFTEEERAVLKKHVERGGFLFANSICASPGFTKSFEEEMKAIFPDDSFSVIALDDPLYSDLYSGESIEKVEIKLPQKSSGRRIERAVRSVDPELRGIYVAGRLGVVFSPYDISCALEKISSMECKGYEQKSALALGINVLLYALEH